MMKEVMDNRVGSIVVSVILGVGLAALFRRVCTDGNCVVIRAPKSGEVDKYFYKIGKDCFKYTPFVVECGQTPAAKI